MNLEKNRDILSLDDIYFKDAFTKTEDKLNVEVNNAKIECLTSKENKFSLDKDGNLIVDSITANTFNIQNIIDMIYPIGSIYISENGTNPSTLFGGTWEQIKDKFLLCDGDIYNAGESGGESTHTLTVNEMPKHAHELRDDTYGVNANFATRGDGGGSSNRLPSFSQTTSYSHVRATNSGGGASHNNMPPYLVVYAWKRVA